jgi:hypothetical protein
MRIGEVAEAAGATTKTLRQTIRAVARMDRGPLVLPDLRLPG